MTPSNSPGSDSKTGPAEMAGDARQTLGYVDESDLDLVLLLDARADGPLTAHLASRAGLVVSGAPAPVRSALRCNGDRETDVEIRWNRSVLFVEDKIDASFTPGQPESYATEVAALRERGYQAAAVLVCPERTLARYQRRAQDNFVYVTCEELAAVARSASDPATRAAAIVFDAAAERRLIPGADPLAAVWGEAYAAALEALSPSDCTVTIRAGSVRRTDSEWIKLDVAGMPKGVDGPWHGLNRGTMTVYVDLDVDASRLPAGIRGKRCKKSYRLEVDCRPISMAEGIDDQREALREAVQAVVRLREWATGVVAAA
jgi:hypothetical protein